MSEADKVVPEEANLKEFDPWIPHAAGDPIKAEDWNNIQQHARKEVAETKKKMEKGLVKTEDDLQKLIEALAVSHATVEELAHKGVKRAAEADTIRDQLDSVFVKNLDQRYAARFQGKEDTAPVSVAKPMWKYVYLKGTGEDILIKHNFLTVPTVDVYELDFLEYPEAENRKKYKVRLTTDKNHVSLQSLFASFGDTEVVENVEVAIKKLSELFRGVSRDDADIDGVTDWHLIHVEMKMKLLPKYLESGIIDWLSNMLVCFLIMVALACFTYTYASAWAGFESFVDGKWLLVAIIAGLGALLRFNQKNHPVFNVDVMDMNNISMGIKGARGITKNKDWLVILRA
ncbi:hypothetical protein [Desulfosediminicola flagellatus]|uniref:hypothetical protein n=1 Tax=Desulfosediminicola flagellatus TaxID=2569541 RepID=UPI0010ACD4BF|nr:hypothetical protein [Desulfosediminicola flagellatus]